MSLVALDKSHATTIASEMVFGWKIKVNKIHFHPLTNCIYIVIYINMQLIWSRLTTNDVLPHVTTLDLSKLF